MMYQIKVGQECEVFIKGDSKEVWARATPKYIGSKYVVFESDKGREYSRRKSTLKTRKVDSLREVYYKELFKEAEEVLNKEFSGSLEFADWSVVTGVLIDKLFCDKLIEAKNFELPKLEKPVVSIHPSNTQKILREVDSSLVRGDDTNIWDDFI